MLLRIDCVMFRVDDIDPPVAFYHGVMGLVPRWRERNQAGVDFACAPGSGLVLHSVWGRAQEASDERRD